jgi:DNA-binding XRE family transcriptional regulator
VRSRRSEHPASQPPEILVPCPHCGQPMRATNGLYLRDRRKAAGWSQREVAALLNVSGPYISDIERNRRACPPSILAAYARLRPVR